MQPLHSASVRAVLVVLLGVSAGAGVIEVAVGARAVHHAEPAAAGYVLAAGTLGSVTGGLIRGHVPHRNGAGWQLAGLGSLVAATLGPASAFLIGAAIAATAAAVATVVRRLVTTDRSPAGPPERTTADSR